MILWSSDDSAIRPRPLALAPCYWHKSTRLYKHTPLFGWGQAGSPFFARSAHINNNLITETYIMDREGVFVGEYREIK